MCGAAKSVLDRKVAVDDSLTDAQAKAWHFVRANAAGREIRPRLLQTLAAHGVSETRLEEVESAIRRSAQVQLAFHPDRQTTEGLSVVESLLMDGRYRSQFETKITSGSPTAFAGGDRDRWEQRLFGGAYDGCADAERPKYGALALLSYADGAAPRFGSCYMVLTTAALYRCTFLYGDSYSSPEELATVYQFESVLAPLCDDVSRTGSALGAREPSLDRFLVRLLESLCGQTKLTVGRALDDYVEAQVHGDIDLGRDVARLVADPAFQKTGTGALLESLCAKFDIQLEWHPGFTLSVADVPADFRGPAMPYLARRIAVADTIDCVAIGVSAASLDRDPQAWLASDTSFDWGSAATAWQYHKQLWHVLVRYGTQQRPE